MIAIGSTLIARYHLLLYLFGASLLFTAILDRVGVKMLATHPLKLLLESHFNFNVLGMVLIILLREIIALEVAASNKDESKSCNRSKTARYGETYQ